MGQRATWGLNAWKRPETPAGTGGRSEAAKKRSEQIEAAKGKSFKQLCAEGRARAEKR